MNSVGSNLVIYHSFKASKINIILGLKTNPQNKQQDPSLLTCVTIA